jgi:hypothetical protein
MKHLRKFNEVNGNRMPRVKEFLVKDLSGRGITSTLEKEDIEDTWDLSEEDDNTEQTLAEFLDEAEMGDTWGTNSVKINCLGEKVR